MLLFIFVLLYFYMSYQKIREKKFLLIIFYIFVCTLYASQNNMSEKMGKDIFAPQPRKSVVFDSLKIQ